MRFLRRVGEWVSFTVIGQGILLFLATKGVYPDRWVASLIERAADPAVVEPAGWIIAGLIGLSMTVILEATLHRYKKLAGPEFSAEQTWFDTFKKFVIRVKDKLIRFLRPQEDELKNGAFAECASFVDSGDYVAAVTCILADEEFREAKARTCTDILSIYQKFGLLKEATEHLAILRNSSGWLRWESSDRANVSVIELKVLSQQHEYQQVLNEYPSLCQSLASSGRLDLVPGVLRRAGIAYAAQGDLPSAIDLLERACRSDVQSHACVTGDVFLAMTKGLAGGSTSPAASIHILVEAQSEYLRVPMSRRMFQANAFKSTVMCLFAEAAVLLGEREERTAGLLRLTAAHLLTSLAKTSPRAEGYAELLARSIHDAV